MVQFSPKLHLSPVFFFFLIAEIIIVKRGQHISLLAYSLDLIFTLTQLCLTSRGEKSSSLIQCLTIYLVIAFYFKYPGMEMLEYVNIFGFAKLKNTVH